MDWPYAYGLSFAFWAIIFALCTRSLFLLLPQWALVGVAVLLAAGVAAFFSVEHMDYE